MLIRVLKEIAGKETNSLTGLAKKMNLRVDMLVQMLKNLERMGYLEFDDASCADDTCRECGVCCTKKNKEDKQIKEIVTGQWKLTEKGRGAI
ncbi:FeoC-like transcriptional regulator [Dehalobacter sp. DCM]|uniref:FeoC-like transcriptional regulator n=1 Tax=Dehalobacter sp. DCM TaxID=2907827 RepID=UPI003081A8B2|nr:FeoC-like transcriptional regulator [Dehalobacter sp. DCM]